MASSSSLLLFLLVSVALLPSSLATAPLDSTAASSIAAACSATRFPDACLSAFASVAAHGPAMSPTDLFVSSVRYTMDHAHLTRTLAYNLTFPIHHPPPYPPTGSHDCVELIDSTLELLSAVLSETDPPASDDAETWLSAALTNQDTCMESLATRPPLDGELISSQSAQLSRFVSNSLALLRHASSGRRLTEREAETAEVVGADGGKFPSWLTEEDRRLLEAKVEDLEPIAIVEQDGSGTHPTINEALAFASLQATGGGRTVIRIGAGTFKEIIRVATKQKNVMLVGAGKGVSVIVSSRSNSGGWTTYETATVAGNGAGFIARDLSIVNSAGPGGGQAVALRVGADHAVIYRVSIQGYQDTLYSHSNRQFYRECDIYGTVDFIFGNAAAVYQGCSISPRSPNVFNTITAQGRRDPNQNTGFVFQGCSVSCPSYGRPTYYGRPWRTYSRVVFMQSSIGSCVNSAGWLPWSGGPSLSSVYYAEYGNSGPGSGTGGRARAAGVHPSLSAAEAARFAPNSFIDGSSWVPGTGVPYNGGL